LFQYVSVGLKENSTNKSLLIYPNPNNGLFEIKLDTETDNAKAVLFSALGQNVYEQKISDYTTLLNCSLLSKGIYSLYVFENEKHFITRKLIIE